MVKVTYEAITSLAISIGAQANSLVLLKCYYKNPEEYYLYSYLHQQYSFLTLAF